MEIPTRPEPIKSENGNGNGIGMVPSQSDFANDKCYDTEKPFLINPALTGPSTKVKMASDPPARQGDTVFLRNLKLSTAIGPDAWNRADRFQPIVISLQLQIDTTTAGIDDDLRSSFSYGQMCKDITAKVDMKKFRNIDHLTSDLAALADKWPGETLKLQALAPKAMLRVEGGFGREFSLRRMETETCGWKAMNWHVESHDWVVKGLMLACIIGVNPHERLDKQNLSIDLRIIGAPEVSHYTEQIKGGFDTWRVLVKDICEMVEPSSFGTLEALATLIAETALERSTVREITVNIEKPSALPFVDGAGVQINRKKAQEPLMIESGPSTEVA